MFYLQPALPFCASDVCHNCFFPPLTDSLKPGLCLFSLMPIWFPSVEVVGVFSVRRCWECWMVAPVVACSCCVVGLAPAHTAAVWLSVWAAGVTGRPFTPARTAISSPSPSVLVHFASSPLHHFCFFLTILCLSPYLPHIILYILHMSVHLSLTTSLPTPF